MALTLVEANNMVQAAISKANELNVKVSIAVCDAGGSLLAFNRMEGASAVSALSFLKVKRPPPLGLGVLVGRCRPILRLYRPSSPIWEVGCFRHKARCHCIRMVNWWGL